MAFLMIRRSVGFDIEARSLTAWSTTRFSAVFATAPAAFPAVAEAAPRASPTGTNMPAAWPAARAFG